MSSARRRHSFPTRRSSDLEIRAVYDNYGYPTKILAASIRHSQHVKDATLVGADVGTMPYKVMKALFKHPLTESGLEQFLKDHANANS